MENILIIKTGAAGDVVRTTSLLHLVAGNIYWITDSQHISILPDDVPGLQVLTPAAAFQSLGGIKFSQVISLEENLECASIASEVLKEDLTGIYLDNGKINYTDNSSYWFNMSRVSKLGREKANRLKAENSSSYQECVCNMLGKKFNGEPYKIFSDAGIEVKAKLIGIEKRSGRQWPCKEWWGYDELISKLEVHGYPFKVFKERSNIRDYLRDIASCSHIVSGDSLAMHVALAYKKTCTAIFNCTSPSEIYDYGLLSKAISPLLSQYFYSSAYDRRVIDSVPLDEVYKTLPL